MINRFCTSMDAYNVVVVWRCCPTPATRPRPNNNIIDQTRSESNMFLQSKGPSIKDVRTKLQKVYSPLFTKCPQWLTPLLLLHGSQSLCPCGHTINFEKNSKFLHQKVRPSASEKKSPLIEKCPHWTPPYPIISDALYGLIGQPLTLQIVYWGLENFINRIFNG